MPKLEWTRHAEYHGWDAHSGRAHLVVMPDQAGLWAVFSTGFGHYIVCEQVEAKDPIELMEYCERRTHEVLLTEFGELIK